MAVFQIVCFLANVSNQDIKINCCGAIDDAHSGQELQGESHQLIWDALKDGALILLLYDVHTCGH